MQTLSLDDTSTLQAIGILADVLDGTTVEGRLDTVLVSKALRQVIATKSQPAFEFAARAFNTLDPDLRRQVAEEADNAAHESVELRGRIGGFLSTPAPARKQQTVTGSGTTGLLTALNLRARRKQKE